MGGAERSEQNTGNAARLPSLGGGTDPTGDTFADVLAGTSVSVPAVAELLCNHPSHVDTILTHVQQRYGNAFATEVVAHASGGMDLEDRSAAVLRQGTKYADSVDHLLRGVEPLLGAYEKARDALDRAAVAELGGAILAAVQLSEVASTALDRELSTTLPLRVSRPGTDPVQEVANATIDLQLDVLRERRDGQRAATESTKSATMRAVTPLTFRGAAIPDVDCAPVDRASISARAGEELVRTLTVMHAAEQLLTEFSQAGAIEDSEKRGAARTRLAELAHRPIDFAFIRAILSGNGLWLALNRDEESHLPRATSEPSMFAPGVCVDDGPLTSLYAETKQRAAQTGWSNDIGQWDAGRAKGEIGIGGSENAISVHHQIMSADPEGRAAILYHLQRQQLLEKLLDDLPWAYTKQIHDGLPHGHAELKTVLQRHFQTDGKWGPDLAEKQYHASSLTKMIRGAADDIGGIGGAILGGLDSALNIVTLGFAHSYGQANDLHNEGLLNDDEYRTTMRQVLVRTTVGMALMMATGGLGRAAVAGMGMQTGRSVAQAAVTAGVEGATLATAELFVLDATDLATGARTQSSGLGEYLLAALAGGAFAAAGAGLTSYLSNRASRYLPAGSMSQAQALAAENPRLAPVMEQLRGVKPGDRVAVRLTMEEAYALREAGLIDARTHRAIRDQLAVHGEIEADFSVLQDLHAPAKSRAADALHPVWDAPTLQAEKIGPTSGAVAAPARPDITALTIDAHLPPGAKIDKLGPNDEWVVYTTASGDARIRFRAEHARTLNEAAAGRNWSKRRYAALNGDGKAFVIEGKHRAAGAAHGDVIDPDAGGVPGQAGVLDYELKPYVVDDVGIPLKNVEIDYSKPDVPAKQSDQMRRQSYGHSG